MAMNAEQFSKWTFKIPDKIVDGRDIDQISWIVPVLFCCMRYMNAAKYRAEGETTDMVERSHPRENNVSLVHILSLGN